MNFSLICLEYMIKNTLIQTFQLSPLIFDISIQFTLFLKPDILKCAIIISIQSSCFSTYKIMYLKTNYKRAT